MKMIKNLSAITVVGVLSLAATTSAYAGCYPYFGW